MALQMLIETIRVLRIIITEQDVLVTLKDLNDISVYIICTYNNVTWKDTMRHNELSFTLYDK